MTLTREMNAVSNNKPVGLSWSRDQQGRLDCLVLLLRGYFEMKICLSITVKVLIRKGYAMGAGERIGSCKWKIGWPG